MDIRAIARSRYCKIKYDDAVATVGRTTFKRISSCVVVGCVGISIYPSIRIARSLNIRAIARSRYRKIEYDNAVAPPKGGESIVVNARFCIDFSMPTI